MFFNMNLEIERSKQCLEKTEYHKGIRIFIKDMLNARAVGSNFIFMHMPFIYVHLTGTIISIKSYKEKLCLEVHDGTNSIICMVEENFFNKIEGYKIKHSQDNDIHTECKKSTAMHQASLMTYRATGYLLKNIPSRQDLHIGDIVIIKGKLGEHNKKRYVFVDKITSGAATDLLNNNEYLQYMYKNEYDYII